MMGNIAKWRNFSKEQIEQKVLNSKSFRELARKLGYAKDGGGTITSLHKMCEELNLDTSHFLGQAWNKLFFIYYGFSKEKWYYNIKSSY